MKPHQLKATKKPTDWAYPMVRNCVVADCWGVLSVCLFKLALKVGLIDSQIAPFVTHLTTAAIIGVIGTTVVVLMYLLIRSSLDPRSDT